jgi:uncharacterized protein YhdP
MKLIFKIVVTLLLIYILMWSGLAAYFSYAERHKELLESNLSSLFNRDVSIQEIRTGWKGLSPVMQLNGFNVAGDTPEQPALTFKSLTAKLAPLSILQLWPRLTEFAVDQPSLEIVSLENNTLQIAGLTLNSNESLGLNPKRLISWLLNHQSAVWLDGEVVWRRRNNEIQRYENIAFVYKRNLDVREISATTVTPNGPFAFKARTTGDVLEADNWDASFEVLGESGQQLLAPKDLSLSVEKGQGHLELKTLDIQQIQDFLLITGLSEAVGWLLDSQLSGRLHDVSFDFSGPLLESHDWSLSAFASDVAFDATDVAPGMSNLAGKVSASGRGGSFEFSAEQAIFKWPRWYPQDLSIDKAAGQVDWSIGDDREIEIVLSDGVFEDNVAKISELNANISIDSKSRNVSSLAQLFKVDSVRDLSFEEGELVERPKLDGSAFKLSRRTRPLELNASARFELASMAQALRYLPNIPELRKLRTWWSNAFIAGSTEGGFISYQGELSKNAMKVGKAKLSGYSSFSDVTIDYGYQDNWPKLMNCKGVAELNDDLLSIMPDQAWLGNDELSNAKVDIRSLFDSDRSIDIVGSSVSNLATVMEFLFAGPLIAPNKRLDVLPITARKGRIETDVKISLPLNDLRATKVSGSAELTDGELILPQGVPMTNVAAKVYFTERSASSKNITAYFLGGTANATLFTTQEAQPPKLEVVANGQGDLSFLQPWVGEHLLSWISGVTQWQGSVAIDGSQIGINVVSDLSGVTISAPAPLAKPAEASRPFSLAMQLGGNDIEQRLGFEYGGNLQALFTGNLAADNSFFDNAIIRVGGDQPFDQLQTAPGINFAVEYPNFDLDSWLSAIIDLAMLEVAPVEKPNTLFLDSMRSVKVTSDNTQFLNRPFGEVKISALSVDGLYWIATVKGDQMDGSVQAEPRSDVSNYRLNLSRLHIPKSKRSFVQPDPINRNLDPSSYPKIELNAKSFKLAGKPLGSLKVVGAPQGAQWKITTLEMIDQGIRTTGAGQWVNNSDAGSLSSFVINTVIDEAGNVLDDMEFTDLVKKGSGTLDASIKWQGAPHEFDFSRLNGDFDLRISDGELVKVEPGSGKLLGLFNFNAFARRLTLDFRDVFSSGLQFDRMRYTGLLADGEAIMRDAYIFSPAVFVQMEGKIDLGRELIDMEIHASPELGGNLTLLSALANPAAGAVVFLTQQIFKDQMRLSSFKSYRALGTWDDFELNEFNQGDTPADEVPRAGSEPGQLSSDSRGQ